MINSALVEAWLNAANNPEGNSINEAHLLFYSLGDEAAKQEYYQAYLKDPALREYLENPYFPPDYDFAALANLPQGSLGYVYYHHISDNGLNIIKMEDFKSYQKMMETAAKGMPEALVYATFRSFQTHDLLHVLTGYGIDHYGELAIQAFGLAQFKRPYPIFLVSAATSHAAFVRPDRIEEYMDALADGWTRGKRAKRLIGVRWEELFDQPLEQLRQEYNLV